MEIQIALKNLRFGQDVGDGINARVTGRLHGIEAMAANIFAKSNTEELAARKGLIENLTVKPIGGGLFGVSNGNRRLAGLHLIYNTDHLGSGCDVEFPCTSHEVSDTVAFEYSLTTAVTAEQLHPVDQYEAFAKLKERGTTEEEIAQRFGMSLRQVEQALALAHLSPAVRKAWRNNELKTEAAKAFTLAGDHKTQDRALDALRHRSEEYGRDTAELDGGDVKEELEIDYADLGALVEFVGVENYVKRGGKVTLDMFGCEHKVSDEKLAKKMAEETLNAECKRLIDAGWGFAVRESTVKNGWSYGRVAGNPSPTEDERRSLTEFGAVFRAAADPSNPYDMSPSQREAFMQHRALDRAISERGFTDKLKAKSGCFVSITHDGLLEIEYGRVKPEEKKAASAEQRTANKAAARVEASGAGASPASDAPKPEPTEISSALRDRLLSQLTHGTRDAIVAALETDMLKSDLAQTLAKIVCAQILPDRPIGMVDAVRTKMHAIREALPANLINNAILKRFDAADYFGNAPKVLVLKAIGEAINPDEARKVSKKTKAEIGKFAIANIGNKIGWVPKEMRTPAYVGPKPTPAAAKAAPAKKIAVKKAAKAATKAKPAAKKKTAKKKA